MLFKIKYGLAPMYLQKLLPVDIKERTNINLQSQSKIFHIGTKYIRLESFKKSFLPLAIVKWNNMPGAVRQIDKLENFKLILKKDYKECKSYYYYGERWPSVHHAQM